MWAKSCNPDAFNPAGAGGALEKSGEGIARTWVPKRAARKMKRFMVSGCE